MTPAEHYEQAEACIAEVMQGIANRQAGGTGDWDFTVPLALAQIHATLATAPAEHLRPVQWGDLTNQRRGRGVARG